MESDHPVAGRLRQTRTAARFETPTVVRHGAPRLGEHTGEVFAELGLSEAEIADAVPARRLRLTRFAEPAQVGARLRRPVAVCCGRRPFD